MPFLVEGDKEGSRFVGVLLNQVGHYPVVGRYGKSLFAQLVLSHRRNQIGLVTEVSQVSGKIEGHAADNLFLGKNIPDCFVADKCFHHAISFR